jgi:hypothetical protein
VPLQDTAVGGLGPLRPSSSVGQALCLVAVWIWPVPVHSLALQASGNAC